MNSGKKSLKRKRALLVEGLSKEERESQLDAMREELNGLYKYFKEVLEEKKNIGLDLATSVNSVIGCLLEGNSLPLSKLVDEIYEIVKERESSFTLASVKCSVLLIGQRSFYGLPNADADVLEDDSESCLWCWECETPAQKRLLFDATIIYNLGTLLRQPNSNSNNCVLTE